MYNDVKIVPKLLKSIQVTVSKENGKIIVELGSYYFNVTEVL